MTFACDNMAPMMTCNFQNGLQRTCFAVPSAVGVPVVRRGQAARADIGKGFGAPAPAPKKAQPSSRPFSLQMQDTVAPTPKKQPEPAAPLADVELAPGDCPCCSGRQFEASPSAHACCLHLQPIPSSACSLSYLAFSCSC